MSERKKTSLSEKGAESVLRHFEHAVLLTVFNLGTDAYPAEITRRLNSNLNRHVALAQVFTALERLEKKGFVTSHQSDPEPIRGGRTRRIFRMEASGSKALRDTAATIARTSSLRTDARTRKVRDAEAKRKAPSPA